MFSSNVLNDLAVVGMAAVNDQLEALAFAFPSRDVAFVRAQMDLQLTEQHAVATIALGFALALRNKTRNGTCKVASQTQEHFSTSVDKYMSKFLFSPMCFLKRTEQNTKQPLPAGSGTSAAFAASAANETTDELDEEAAATLVD